MIGAGGGGECKDVDEVVDGDRATAPLAPRADELLRPERDRGEAERGEMARGVLTVAAAAEALSCFHGCLRLSSDISCCFWNTWRAMLIALLETRTVRAKCKASSMALGSVPTCACRNRLLATFFNADARVVEA